MFVFCLPGESELNISQNKYFFFSLFGPDYFKILHKNRLTYTPKFVLFLTVQRQLSSSY